MYGGDFDPLFEERLFDRDCASGNVLLQDNIKDIELVFYQLAIAIYRHCIHFAPTKCKVLLKD